VQGVCYRGACVCWAGATGADCSVKTTRMAGQCGNRAAGINPGGLADWSTEISFLDLAKRTRNWIASVNFNDYKTWGDGRDVRVRPDGYPSELLPNQGVYGLMVRDTKGHIFPEGVYTVLYDGDGLLDFVLESSAMLRSAGKITVYFKPSPQFNNGFCVKILRTNPADPVRNIRVLPPGVEEDYASVFVFHPQFLNLLSPFSTLRMMDWSGVNNENYEVEWANRTLPTHFSQVRKRSNVFPHIFARLR
jgi:hypothetical protein